MQWPSIALTSKHQSHYPAMGTPVVIGRSLRSIVWVCHILKTLAYRFINSELMYLLHATCESIKVILKKTS